MPIKCAINNVIKNLNKNNIHKYIYVYAKMQKKKIIYIIIITKFRRTEIPLTKMRVRVENSE